MSEVLVRQLWKIADDITVRRFPMDTYIEITAELLKVIEESDSEEEAKRMARRFLEKSKLVLQEWLETGYSSYASSDSANKQRVLCEYLKRLIRGELIARDSGPGHPSVEEANNQLRVDAVWNIVFERIKERSK